MSKAFTKASDGDDAGHGLSGEAPLAAGSTNYITPPQDDWV